MPVLGMVLVTTAIFSTACKATCRHKAHYQQRTEPIRRMRRRR